MKSRNYITMVMGKNIEAMYPAGLRFQHKLHNMKIQEILDILSLQELPAPSPTAKGKCAALVQRVTGQKDYVITKNGGVIIDIGYRCSIVKILEYYPVPPAVKEKPTPSEPASYEKFNRFKAINFLEKQNLNKSSLFKKSDEQLKELMDGFK